jgi:hypothetical protein
MMSTAMFGDDLGYSRGTKRNRHVRPYQRDSRASKMLAGEAATIREMVAMLDTITFAGQRHVMSKIVDFMDEHVRDVLLRLGPQTRGHSRN